MVIIELKKTCTLEQRMFNSLIVMEIAGCRLLVEISISNSPPRSSTPRFSRIFITIRYW